MNLKLLRLSAWLLLLATIITLLSGFYSLKPYLAPWFSPSLARQLHSGAFVLIFIFLFYLHSLTGVFHLLARHKNLRRKAVKIIIAIIWTAILILFIYYFFISYSNSYANVSLPQVANTNQNSNSNTLAAKTYSSTEVAKHNKPSDCWLIINNNIYDLSSYLNIHPGGAQTISPYCGQDGTIAFATKDRNQSHSNYANQLLQSYLIGTVK